MKSFRLLDTVKLKVGKTHHGAFKEDEEKIGCYCSSEVCSSLPTKKVGSRFRFCRIKRLGLFAMLRTGLAEK